MQNQNSDQMIASLAEQNLEKANKYFQRALQEDDSESLLALGEYLERIGFYPQAKAIFLQIRPSFPEVNINLAQIASEDGDMDEAFNYLNEIAADSQYYLEALVTMADLYDAEGLTDVAYEKLLQARQLSEDPLLIFGLAELALSLENYQTAIEHYAQLDNREILENTGISTYERIGRAYAALGKFEAAIEFLEKALEIEFDDQIVFELACLLYDQGNAQKANIYFKQLDALNPDFEGYELPYALSLHEEHQTAEALRLLQQSLSKNEFDSRVLILASQYAYEEHDKKAAENYLLKALEVAEEEEEVLLPLSNLYLEAERFEDVIALDSGAVDNLLTKWNLARAYRELEDDEKALVYYQELAKELTDNPEFLEDYIYYLRELGQQAQTADLIETYLHLVPDDHQMIDLKNDIKQ